MTAGTMPFAEVRRANRVVARTAVRGLVRRVLNLNRASDDPGANANLARWIVAKLQEEPDLLIALAGYDPAALTDPLPGSTPPSNDPDDGTLLTELGLAARTLNLVQRQGVFKIETLIHYVERHRDHTVVWDLTAWDGCGTKLSEEICRAVDAWQARRDAMTVGSGPLDGQDATVTNAHTGEQAQTAAARSNVDAPIW